MAGIESDLVISANYRQQWNALGNPYTTNQFSAILPYFESKHAKPFGHKGGLGLSVYNDIAGENNNFKTLGLNANFAYNLPFDRNFVNVVTFGLQGGMVQKRIDANEISAFDID